MKKQLYNLVRHFAMITIIIGSVSHLSAQGASFELLNDLRGYYVLDQSENGRFIVGGNSSATAGNKPFIWDRETNEHTIIGVNCFVNRVSNDGVAVGIFPDPAIMFNGKPVVSGGWWKDGVWYSLGLHPDHLIEGIGSSGGSNAVAISADGQYIGGYVKSPNPAGVLPTYKIQPIVWKKSGETYVVHKIYNVDEASNQGGRPWNMSDDGEVLCGWEANTSGVWIPTIWTDVDVKLYSKITGGHFRGINSDGTKAVGGADSKGFIFNTIDKGEIISGRNFDDISEDGVAVGDGIWSEKIGGLWDFAKYIKVFWNIEVDQKSLVFDGVSAISDDGKYIAGSVRNNGARVPFYVVLEGYPVALAPNVVNTLLKVSTRSVEIMWEKPLDNGCEILGYNVYRGDEKLNVSGLLTEFKFTDTNPQTGANGYSVTAVYNYDKETESGKSIISFIEVIEENGCFAPKKVSSEVIYNKTVHLSWGMPLPNYGSLDDNLSTRTDNSNLVEFKPNYLKTYQLKTGNEFFPATDGKSIYLLGQTPVDRFFKYNMDGDYETEFKIGSPSMPNWYSGLTYDGTSFYTTRDRQSKSTLFFELDLANKKVTKTIQIQTQPILMKHLTYIPTLDNNEGGFEVGNDTISWFVKKDLTTVIGEGLKDISGVYGTAYYNGIVYASIQREGELVIMLFDAETGEAKNEYINIRNYDNLRFSETAKLGGISTFKSVEGFMSLVVVVIDGKSNSLVFLQLDEMEGLLGYNVYKNGKKINETILKETSFTEDVIAPGDYEYTITSLFDNGCESNYSFPMNVIINPLGTCNTPENVRVELIRNNAQLTWVKPKEVSPHKLLGYNLYRNDTKINAELLTNTFYTDTDLEIGEYTYKLDAKYDNSCISDMSSPVMAKIGGFNVANPPTDLSVKVYNKTQAKLNWSTPAIGDYKNLRWYNGAIEWSVGEEDEDIVYVACKWDAEDLDTYFDYTLTDVEFYPTVNIPHTFYVYVNGEVVTEQSVATVTPKAFNLIKLDSPVLIEKGKELMVGYKVAGGSKIYPIGADKQLNESGKGDLLSYDGKTWKSVYKDQRQIANWAITIRLMPYSVKPSTPIEMLEVDKLANGSLIFSDCEAKAEKVSIFTNKEVVGYNVYKDNVKLTTVTGNEYTETLDAGANGCYSVEALYTENRTSGKTSVVCTYGECEVATELDGTATTSSVSLTWSAPSNEITNPVGIKYYEDNGTVDAISFGTEMTFYALIQSTVIDNLKYNYLKLKSIEAFILQECSVSIVVIQDGKVMFEKAVTNVEFGDFNTFELPNGGFEIDLSKNVLIGLKIKAAKGIFTIGIDDGPSVNYRGDVMSSDGKEFTTLKKVLNLKVGKNWKISANLEQSAQSVESVIGYNIYRNGNKIETIAATTSYDDNAVEEDKEYEYYVTTIWNTGCESQASNKMKVVTKPDGLNSVGVSGILVYPNPTKHGFNIAGEYKSLRIYNSAGILTFEQARVDNYIDVSNLQQGIYIVEFSDETKIIHRAKLIITK